MISTRTLALARYKRNHEFMEEVFKRAAFGNVNASLYATHALMLLQGALVTPPQLPPAYSIFDRVELESKVVSIPILCMLLRLIHR